MPAVEGTMTYSSKNEVNVCEMLYGVEVSQKDATHNLGRMNAAAHIT